MFKVLDSLNIIKIKNSAGFSLAETIVAMGISTLITLGGAAILIQTKQLDKKALIDQELSSLATEAFVNLQRPERCVQILNTAGFNGTQAQTANGSQVQIQLPNGTNISEGTIINRGGVELEITSVRFTNAEELGRDDQTTTWLGNVVFRARKTGSKLLGGDQSQIFAGRLNIVLNNNDNSVDNCLGEGSFNASVDVCEEIGARFDPTCGGLATAGCCVWDANNLRPTSINLCPVGYSGSYDPNTGVRDCRPQNNECAEAARGIANGNLNCTRGLAGAAPPRPRAPPTQAMIDAANSATPPPTPTGPPPVTGTCTVPASLNWSTGAISCQANGGDIIPSGRTISKSDATGPNTGTVTYSCSSGTLTQTSAVCSEIPPQPQIEIASNPVPTSGTVAPPTTTPDCQDNWVDYAMCLAYSAWGGGSISCGTEPNTSCAPVTTTPAPTIPTSTLPPPPPPPANCLCGAATISNNQYCGFCYSGFDFGFGYFETIYEVRQCVNGELHIVNGVNDVQAVSCTGLNLPVYDMGGYNYQIP